MKETNQEDKILSKIKNCYELCSSYYEKEFKRIRLLDATDKGHMWDALKIKFPKYQILPNTNHVSYIKNNILASIYTVTKGASILPTSDEDKDITMYLNIVLEHVWDLCDIGYYQFLAGERAALCNIGITQIGWDETLTGGNGDSFYKGNVTMKNINPLKFMRDPFATSLETAGYCMTVDNYHKSVFLENPHYTKTFKAYLETCKSNATTIQEPKDKAQSAGAKDYYTLLTFWHKHGNKVDEYHTINGEYLLYKKEDIQPSEFPFAILYCNTPADSLIGSSECHNIFRNSVAKNLMDSLILTAEYKNQYPPKFISTSSGLNIQSFAKHGDDANKTFVVNGRADQAVHYHQYPTPSPTAQYIGQNLEQDIQLVSGVDGKYTGRNTGSVITTGGVEEMLNRATLIDTPKIILYEKYVKRLTNLVLFNLIQYAPKRAYFVRKPNTTAWETVTIDFPEIDNDTLFAYSINISSELPKDKQRIAATANMLMEKQMQYQQEGSSVQLITEEEWLSMVDLPNKEQMLERMGRQRLANKVDEVADTLFSYSDLVQNGMNPQDAILETANMLQNPAMQQQMDTQGAEAPMLGNPQ